MCVNSFIYIYDFYDDEKYSIHSLHKSEYICYCCCFFFIVIVEIFTIIVSYIFNLIVRLC